MSERHLMFCNLIAWKEGDEYVFEDGSKAYPYPDNDKRFDKFMLIPDWVVKGLTDTPFRYFGFKSGRIHIKQLGVFTREEFEREIVKYKYEELDKYIGKTIRLEDGNKVTLKKYDKYKFKLNKREINGEYVWIHIKDVVNGRNILCSYGTKLIDNEGVPYTRIKTSKMQGTDKLNYSISINNEIKVVRAARLGFAEYMPSDNIYPIISGFMYEDRVLYYNGMKACKIQDVILGTSRHRISSVILKILDTDETLKVLISNIFIFIDKDCRSVKDYTSVRHRWAEAKIVNTYFNHDCRCEYKTLEFCDGSRTDIPTRYVSRGNICHSDVLDAWRMDKDIQISSYFYENDKWFVKSNFGILERSEFLKEAIKFSRFKETCVGKTFISKEGHEYTVESIEKGRNYNYCHIRFADGRTRICIAFKAYTGGVLNSHHYIRLGNSYDMNTQSRKNEKPYRNRSFMDKYTDWSDSVIGLRFRVLGKKDDKYRVELENKDITWARKSKILNGRVYPEFISRGYEAYIGTYESRFILSMYFDFAKDLYVLLTKEHDILLVSHDGQLKKTVKHDEE